MTSRVTSKGQTVVPKAVRESLHIQPGCTLDWRVEGETLRVVKLATGSPSKFLNAIRRLGRIQAAPRDRRPVEPL